MREAKVSDDENICCPAQSEISARDDAMISASGGPLPARALLPAGGIFFFFSLASLGLLTIGPSAWAATRVAALVVPLFALLFIAFLSMACAIFTLYQEPLFIRFPGLRRGMVAGSLILAAGLVLLVRYGGVSPQVPWVLASANLIVLALLLGNFLASGLNRPAELVPACVVMSVADLLSVFSGPSSRMIEGIDVFYRDGQVGPVPWADFLLVKMAVPGVDHLVPVFGVADVVILAFLTAAAHKFGLNDNLLGRGLGQAKEGRGVALRFPAAGGGLALGVLAAHGLGMFLPALPLIALFFLACTVPRHAQMRLLGKVEWAVVLVSLVLLSGWAIWV
jgi:hypothetical protein